MQTRPLPETPVPPIRRGGDPLLDGGRNQRHHPLPGPARAGEPGDEFHATVSGSWHVLSGREATWRRDKSGEEVTALTPGVLHRHPGVSTAFQYRCTGAEDAAVSVHHHAALAGRRGSKPRSKVHGVRPARVGPVSSRHCTLKQRARDAKSTARRRRARAGRGPHRRAVDRDAERVRDRVDDRGRRGDRARLAHALDAAPVTGDGVSMWSTSIVGTSVVVG